MLATIFACAIDGLDARVIEVEVDFNPRAQLPQFTTVGLPDAAEKESRKRVRSAMRVLGVNRAELLNLRTA